MGEVDSSRTTALEPAGLEGASGPVGGSQQSGRSGPGSPADHAPEPFRAAGISRDAPRLAAFSQNRLGSLLALGVFLLLLITGRGQDLLPSPARMGLVLAWPIVALGYMLSGQLAIVAGYCIAGGFLLRWVDFFPGGGSDVLPVTNEAIGTLLSGGNPYNHFYLAERPPGFDFNYPPGELLVHLPGYLVWGLNGVRFTEVMAAVLVMLGFVWLARTVSVGAGLPALALYAGLPNLINLSVDAGNDTSTGAVLFLAVIAFVWALRPSAKGGDLLIAGLAAGLAMATKQTTAFVLLMLGIYLWQCRGSRVALRYFGAAVALCVVVSIPFVLMSPIDYILGLTRQISIHSDVYGWNIWVFAQAMHWPVLDVGRAVTVELVATAIAMLTLLQFRYERLTPAVLAGLLITLVALLTARWTSYSYFAMVAPVVLLLPVLQMWDESDDRNPKNTAAVAVREAPGAP